MCIQRRKNNENRANAINGVNDFNFFNFCISLCLLADTKKKQKTKKIIIPNYLYQILWSLTK